MAMVMRSPLEDTTNSPPTSPPSTIRSVTPALSHKRSKRNLHLNLDSSETLPSPHSSVYDASVIQRGSSNTSPESHSPPPPDPKPQAGSSTWTRNEPEESQSWEQTVLDDDGNLVPASFLQPVTPIHKPHKLDPIKERTSFLTMTTRRSASSSPLHRPDSHSSPRLAAHKRSFSTSDIPSPNPATAFLPPPIEFPPIDLPQPARPVKLPPIRISTPPNLPSFNTKEAANYRLPPPRLTRLRDMLNPNPTSEEIVWRRQTVGLPRGVIMRGDDGTLVHGRFKPLMSGHQPLDVVKGDAVQRGRPPIPHRNITRARGASLDRESMEAARVLAGPRLLRSESQADQSRRTSAENEQREWRERDRKREKKMEKLKHVWRSCCAVDEWWEEEEEQEQEEVEARTGQMRERGGAGIGERGRDEYALVSGVEIARAGV